MTPDSLPIALIAVRFVHFFAVLVLFGGVLFRVYADASLRSAGEVRSAFDRWLWHLLLFAGFISLLTSVAWLLVQTAIMSDSWADALSSGTVATVLFETDFGRVWAGRLVIAAFTVLALLAFAKRTSRAGTVGVAGLSALLVGTLAGTGHAANGKWREPCCGHYHLRCASLCRFRLDRRLGAAR